ncbi:MAG TPA: methyltransferase domain-containing protein [Actinophytocola sp.]|jgi:SAM-dependent methyltransferase|nr:methyltransferase domain-containing protein [Actinophytocola sp.]
MSSAFTRADLETRVRALDTQSRLSGVGRLRSWVLEVLAPRPGERVADIGSGTGEHVRAMAEAVGAQGEAIGVEPNDGMRAEAARRAASSGVTFVAGSAYALPFADASVDVVTCERVFQHLRSPAEAAGEIARVLRPGGRVAVTDTDWATAIVHPGDPDTVGAVGAAMRAGITNPLAGRLLPGQLTAAGLTVDDIGSQALVQSREAATGPLMTMLGRMARDRGAISEARRASFMADVAAGAERGDFLMSVTMFAVAGHRPV